MDKSKKIIIILSVVAAVLAMIVFYQMRINKIKQIIEKENTPENINIPDKNDVFAAKADLIRIKNLKPGDKIKSPFVIEGEARGNWFFEASFPIVLLDKDGQQIAIIIATATSDWMTVDFVPFKATLEFSQMKSSEGTIIFKKDNPSGLPEHDDSLSFPIQF